MSLTDRSEVVVTGIGLITGLGGSRESTWLGIREGRSAIRRLSTLGPEEAGAPLPYESADDDEPVLELLDRLVDEAVADARLDLARIDRTRVATHLGLSKGGVRSLSRLHHGFRSTTAAQQARLWRDAHPGAGVERITRRFDLRGPCSAPVAACATGLVAAIQGARCIREGLCDHAFVGSADVSLEPILLASFRNMKALATVRDRPENALRPWDRERSGFLIGEGGAVLVLESAASARRRGARIYATFAAGRLGGDAHHITGLNPDPSRLARLVASVPAAIGLPLEEIDHVNVHGTATLQNDPLECRAIRLALGAGADRVSCSANKAQIGHLLGAAGSAELALTCLAIRDGFVPPTLNLDNPDPFCDLDATPGAGRRRQIRHALKISIGFGGHLAAALLSELESS